MDEVARRAGVNKAHIYYYFDSKEELLKELLRPNIAEAAALVGSTFEPGRATRYSARSMNQPPEPEAQMKKPASGP